MLKLSADIECGIWILNAVLNAECGMRLNAELKPPSLSHSKQREILNAEFIECGIKTAFNKYLKTKGNIECGIPPLKGDMNVPHSISRQGILVESGGRI